MAQKPSIPKGTRDFTPEEVSKRTYILSTIKGHFETFGFQPIETPSFENYDTLMGKYGDEGDRLVFKILNSGDFLNKVDDITYSSKNSSTILPKISEKALRYDLTVPFARYVVMHQNEIQFPFKRYQMQPVWRADRPQKGRFREFYQCDADVVGANSLLQEVEFVQLYDAVFNSLDLKGTVIKMNNRKILSGIAEVIGAKHLLVPFTVALDKLDKIGEEKVKQEMFEKGISQSAIDKTGPLFNLSGSNEERIGQLSSFLSDSEIGLQGVNEIKYVLKTISALGLKSTELKIDVTLARGLNYYTGCIFEVSAPENVSMGSIGGGGRYDDLTGVFGLKDVSGVGISFGLDRIYLVLEELGLFPENITRSLDIFFLNFGEDESQATLKIITYLRNEGVKADIYPSPAKMQKQLKYANSRNIPYVVFIGEKELGDKKMMVKNMLTGQQNEVPFENLAALLQLLKG